MSGVVLRCPNCGTTRAAPGECDACHEAAVRYHCTNHTPGRWLESGACPACGAGFGDPPRPSPPSPPAHVPAPRAPAGPVRRPAAAPPGRRPAPVPERTEFPIPPRWPHGPGDRSTTDADVFVRADRTPPPIEVDLAPASRALGGCLTRLVLLALFMILAFVVGIFLLGGSLLRLFGFY